MLCTLNNNAPFTLLPEPLFQHVLSVIDEEVKDLKVSNFFNQWSSEGEYEVVPLERGWCKATSSASNRQPKYALACAENAPGRWLFYLSLYVTFIFIFTSF
jgi:hypothetical protein